MAFFLRCSHCSCKENFTQLERNISLVSSSMCHLGKMNAMAKLGKKKSNVFCPSLNCMLFNTHTCHPMQFAIHQHFHRQGLLLSFCEPPPSDTEQTHT